jgi:biopolymer transport protein ExbB/TolQ
VMVWCSVARVMPVSMTHLVMPVATALAAAARGLVVALITFALVVVAYFAEGGRNAIEPPLPMSRR